MANVLVQDTSLTAIADAIRTKNGETTQYKPAEMATAIAAIPSGGGLDIDWVNDVIITITNATTSIALPDGYTIEDIKLAILPTTGSGSFGSSVRYLFAIPGVLTPEVINYTESSRVYNYILPAISMGAYGDSSQTGSPGIGLYLIDYQNLFNYSSAYKMKYLGLRAKAATPGTIEGYFVSTTNTETPANSSGGYLSYLASGAGLIVLKNKEVA